MVLKYFLEVLGFTGSPSLNKRSFAISCTSLHRLTGRFDTSVVIAHVILVPVVVSDG